MSTNSNIMSPEHLTTTVQELSLARNIEEVMEIVRSVARNITGADGSTFILREGDLCYYGDEDAISPLWKGSRFPMNTCISGWVMLNKKPAVIEDIYADNRIPVDAYKPTFVKSLAMVPIRTIKPLGAIGNYWANKHKPTDQEVSMLQALADITAVSIENINIRNELEDKLNERTQMLDELQKQKNQLEEFTYIIAHNMRAPLSNLLLLAEMIKKSTNESRKELLIDKQQPILEHLHSTFDELVEAIHVKTDFSVKRDHIELKECFENTCNLLHAEVVASSAEITSDFTNAKTVYFPEKYISSILFNLLSNSIKYRDPAKKLKVNIRSFKKNGWTWIEVEDNALGIDLEKYGNQIFMLQKTFHDHPNAKGFGLFITKNQIDSMGGEIKVKSTPKKGSIFSIKLNKNR